MKFSEDLLKEFNLESETEREPVNVMKVDDMLSFLKLCAERIFCKSELYCKNSDANVQLDCIDIVTAKLNDFSQAFCDIIIFMRKSEGTYKGITSLRYCINSFDTFEFNQTEQEQLFLRELLLRNEITHDYFNREMHLQKLIWMMQNCSHGALDVYNNLYDYCKKQNLLNCYSEAIVK